MNRRSSACCLALLFALAGMPDVPGKAAADTRPNILVNFWNSFSPKLNPEFDTEHNHYFASHCTCATKLHGPSQKDAPYHLRPFVHQMPKSLALDVQWPAGEPATLVKCQTGKNTLDAWRARVIASPTCPPTGGCATRALVSIDGVADVCSVCSGPHPILYCGDYSKHAKVFAQLYGLLLRTNA